MSIKANRIERYYDSHTRDDEELTQTFFHQAVIEYLIEVLKWLYHGQNIGMATNVNFYVTANPYEAGISPDVAVVDGLKIFDRPADEAGSYYVGPEGPAPRVVFEMSSRDTWMLDLGLDNKVPVEQQKPARYAAMGIAEYFAFDPNQPGFWIKDWRKQGRFAGWRMGPTGQYSRIEKNEQGWLWSEQLDSWLVIDGQLLSVYDREGQLRLTEAEASQRMAESERQQAEIERQRAEAAIKQVEVESRRAEIEKRRADTEQQRAETERERAEIEKQRADDQADKLAEVMEKLRLKGIDLDLP